MSQLQEPYTSVGYLCERTPFLSVLKLKHPSLLEKEPQQGQQGSIEPSWTAWDVCEGKNIFMAVSDISALTLLVINSCLLFFCNCPGEHFLT